MKTLGLTHVRGDEDRESDAHPLDFRLISRMFARTAPYKHQRAWLVFLVVARSIQLPLLAWIVGAIINGPITRRDIPAIAWGAALFGALATLTNVMFHFRQRYALELGEAVVQDLRLELFAKLQSMPMAFYDRTRLGRMLSRMTSDLESVRVGVQDVFFVGVVGLGQTLVSAALMAWCDVWLFLVIALLGPLLWWTNYLMRERMSKAYRDVQESFSRVTSTLAESIDGMRVTQSFAREPLNAKLFHELVTDHGSYNLTAARVGGVFTPLLELTNQGFVAILLLLGGYRVLAGSDSLSIGDLIQFFFLTAQFFGPIQALSNQYIQALTAMAGAERVFALLDEKPDWSDPPEMLTAESNPHLQGHVTFEHVNYRYVPDRPVLRDVSFDVHAGETVALVGSTGSGKSTIAALLAKFYLPNEGQILIDGRDLRSLHVDWWRRQVAIVPQQGFLFTGTVLDNIRFGRPEATEAEVRAAAEALAIDDLLDALPDGYLTQVGERGAKLSAGMRQLVCFARAMLISPCVLVLDEATSAVDAVTEQRIQSAVERLVAGRTSFIIAHRLSTIRHADLVLVVDHGRIAEQGSHEHLLLRGGLYSELHQRFFGQAAA